VKAWGSAEGAEFFVITLPQLADLAALRTPATAQRATARG
jgi:hypothetical protein